jgi:hypothetical protein
MGWFLRCAGGLELTEKELGCWDNVPTHIEIVAAAMVIDRQGAPPYVIEYCGYEQYCIARIGSAAQGMEGQCVGYSVTVIKQDFMLEHEIRSDGMRVIVKPRNECDVPDRCFRRGRPKRR